MDRRRIIALVASVVGIAGLFACGEPEATKGERECTPGAYVFCRCSKSQTGTKLCKDDGQSFAECKCTGSTNDEQTIRGEDEETPRTPPDTTPVERTTPPGTTPAPTPTPVPPPARDAGPAELGPSCKKLETCCDNLRTAGITGSAGQCDRVVADRNEYSCYLADEEYKKPDEFYDPVCF